jgi:hypothetical protein
VKVTAQAALRRRSILGVSVGNKDKRGKQKRRLRRAALAAGDRAQSSYRSGRTHEKERGDCGPSGSLRAVVSWMRLRKRRSPSAARASSNEQCKTPWIVRTPSACKPCSVSTVPRFTSASQSCCSCSGDTSQVYNPVPVPPPAGRLGRSRDGGEDRPN